MSILRGVVRQRTVRFLGPAVIVSVAYMDPGNWGTDIAAGSRFGYQLLWVVVLSNAMGILVQYLAAKLGLATGHSLAENCRMHFPRPLTLFLWSTAEVAAIGTDLAEVLGAAVALNLLFGLPLLPAALLTGLDVFFILGMQRWGLRKLELTIGSMIGIIFAAYAYEIVLTRPAWDLVLVHSVLPQLTAPQLAVAVGIVGATVMPHAVFLHSSLVQRRIADGDALRPNTARRSALPDTASALVVAGLVNAAILIMSAAVFHFNGREVVTIEAAHRTLGPLLGEMSSLAFAIALLASGLSSSVAATLAGQVIMEGFLHLRIRLWVRRLFTRLITLLPAIVAIGWGVNALDLLVISQITLSLQLPFTLIPLLHFTRRSTLMKAYVNGRGTNLLAMAVAGTITMLNVLLLLDAAGLGLL